jgi:hypothetical protein
VHDVQCVVEERKSLRDGEVQGQQSSHGNHLVEWAIQVESCRKDSDVALCHPGRECAGTCTDVEADPNTSILECQHLMKFPKHPNFDKILFTPTHSRKNAKSKRPLNVARLELPKGACICIYTCVTKLRLSQDHLKRHLTGDSRSVVFLKVMSLCSHGTVIQIYYFECIIIFRKLAFLELLSGGNKFA